MDSTTILAIVIIILSVCVLIVFLTDLKCTLLKIKCDPSPSQSSSPPHATPSPSPLPPADPCLQGGGHFVPYGGTGYLDNWGNADPSTVEYLGQSGWCNCVSSSGDPLNTANVTKKGQYCTLPISSVDDCANTFNSSQTGNYQFDSTSSTTKCLCAKDKGTPKDSVLKSNQCTIKAYSCGAKTGDETIKLYDLNGQSDDKYAQKCCETPYKWHYELEDCACDSVGDRNQFPDTSWVQKNLKRLSDTSGVCAKDINHNLIETKTYENQEYYECKKAFCNDDKYCFGAFGFPDVNPYTVKCECFNKKDYIENEKDTCPPYTPPPPPPPSGSPCDGSACNACNAVMTSETCMNSCKDTNITNIIECAEQKDCCNTCISWKHNKDITGCVLP